MFQIINAIFFGTIQGITEFLPISSSGHLFILHQIFDIKINNLTFDVALHLGTLLALLLFFKQKLYFLFKNIFSNFKQKNFDSKLSVGIILATIPAALVGILWEDLIDLYLRNLIFVSFALILIGILLIFVDKKSIKVRNFESLKLSEMILIGIAQTLALIPGVSRSGITIIAGLSLKLQRKAAAEFSFLLAIPIIAGAGLKKIINLNFNSLQIIDIGSLIIGVCASFLVGYLVIKYFIKYLENSSLSWFGWYRIILGFVILFWVYL